MMLQDMGIPIEATRGPGGGYQLRPGFKMPPLMLTDDEALAIVLSLIAARRQGIPAAMHTIEGALAKIERVLPTGLRTRLQAVQSAVAFVPKPVADQPPGEMVLLLSTAVQQQRRVRLRYRSQGQETVRSVDPYGLVLHWEHWYMAGWCHLRQGVRVFRLDRILDAVAEEETFTPPQDFDSLQVILESLATVPAGWEVEVWLEMSLEEAQRRIPPGSAVFEQSADGIVMHAHVDRLEWFARILLTFEAPFVIRRPPELREALRALASEAAALAERG
jgi:predicted DNA-binding transcriptional regulator YafY